MGEMGTGTLYTNEEAFLGEKIFRQAIDINEMLSSYVIQGGLMPEFIQMFGKAKNQRALMTGVDKSEPNGENGIERKKDQFNKIKQILDLGGFNVGAKEMRGLEKNVIDTISSFEEAARSVAYQIASPLFKDIPEEIPIHYHWSYNDWANMQETLDTLIPKLRKIHQKMGEATKNLPKWREERDELKGDISDNLLEKLIGERVYYYVNTKRSNYSSGKFPEKGNEYKKLLYSFFETQTGKKTQIFKALKNKTKRELEGITGKKINDKRKEEEFDSNFYEVVHKFYDELTTFNRLKYFYEEGQKKFQRTSEKINSLEDKIHETERFENSLMVEDEGPAWFTKKIAISPMEAKALYMITKQVNKDFYDTLFSEVKKINGKNHKFFLHTDDIITIEIPDPQYSIEGKENYKNRPVGTLILSVPRTNAQKSNEPILNTFSDLQSFHEGEISEAVKKNKKKPEIMSEFNKRDFAFPDICLTSYGADGYNFQEKAIIDQSTVAGCYSKAPLITSYIKVPTRHDTQKLGELMIKGNKGTWPAKRIVKGGNTTGINIYIQHPDQSNESIFVDDDYLKEIGKKYGKIYSKLENEIQKFELEGNAGELEKTKNKMKILLDKVSPKIYKVFLENDMHLGSYSTPGRTSNIDGIKSSQLIAIQTTGLNNIKYSIMTEALHGEQAWKSYDSKREVATNNYMTLSDDSVNLMKRIKILENKMRERNAKDKEILEATQLYIKEFEDGQSKFKPEDQKAIFMEVLHPVNVELMENKIPFFVGDGNHWMAKKENEGESSVISSMFDRKYQEQGLLRRGQSCSGNSFSYDSINLPGEGGEIPAVITHKMWHGREEISLIGAQAVSTREGAVYYFTADRHHYGAIAERGKMGILDVGKQTTIPFRKLIGKSASLRGTIIGGYGGKGELILSTRSYLDPIIDIISGWDYKMGILSRSKSLIEEGMNDDSIYREMKNMNFILEKNKDKYKSIENKLR